jgi:hypothetical protein
MIVTRAQAAAQATPNLRVIETDPYTDPRWEAFVLSHPDGSVYHHPAWLKALSMEYSQKGLYLACESAQGELVALMPMMYTRGLPLTIGGSSTGRRLSSLPRTPLAGPLSTDQHATKAIIQTALEYARRESGMHLQIKTSGSKLDGLVDGVFCSPWRNSFSLTLPSPSEGPFRILDAHVRAKVKWALNKAAKNGLAVRHAETEAQLDEWYGLYLDTMRRNAVPPRPYRFFLALWDLLRPLGLMQLLVAERAQRSKREMLAGSIFLMFGHTVSYAFNGSRRKDLFLRPNDAIQWRAINDACTCGYRYVDFGEVPDEHHQLAKFKSKWGATPTRLYRYSSLVSSQSGPGSDYMRGAGGRLARNIWRRLPISTTNWLGDRLYRCL